MSITNEKDWQEYYISKDISLRNKLIIENIGMAHSAASKAYSKFNKKVSIDDLKSHSYIGLISAVEKYNPTLGYTFSTYASRRIYGAIIDSLRLEGNSSRAKDEDNIPLFKIVSTEDLTHLDDDGNVLSFEDTHSSKEDLIWKDFNEKYIIDLMQELLNSLDKEERDVIYLYFFENKTDKDISKILGISTRSVYNVKVKTISLLRRKITTKYGLQWKDIAA